MDGRAGRSEADEVAPWMAAEIYKRANPIGIDSRPDGTHCALRRIGPAVPKFT